MPHASDPLYQALTAVIPSEALATQDNLRLESRGFMALVCEVLARRGPRLHVSLAHYFEANGDLVPDPDLELEVDTEARTVRPLAITTQAYYVRAIDHDGQGRELVHAGRVRDLRAFAFQWFRNLKDQGFCRQPPAADAQAGKP